MSIGRIISAGVRAVKASTKAKKAKSSFKSMNPIEKAFTAAKISGRTMKSVGKIKHSEMHRPTAKLLNRAYATAAATQVGIGAKSLLDRKSNKKSSQKSKRGK